MTLRYDRCNDGLGADGGNDTIPTSSSVERESTEMRDARRRLNLIRLNDEGGAVNVTVDGIVRQSLPLSATDKGDLLRLSHPRAVDAHPFILLPLPLPPLPLPLTLTYFHRHRQAATAAAAKLPPRLRRRQAATAPATGVTLLHCRHWCRHRCRASYAATKLPPPGGPEFVKVRGRGVAFCQGLVPMYLRSVPP